MWAWGGRCGGRAQDGSIRKCKRFSRLSKTVKHKCLRVCLYKGTVWGLLPMDLVIGDCPWRVLAKEIDGAKPALFFAMMVKVDDDLRGANAQL